MGIFLEKNIINHVNAEVHHQKLHKITIHEILFKKLNKTETESSLLKTPHLYI